MARSLARAVAVLGLVLHAHSGIAHADDEERARALFVEAGAAIDGGHLAEARDLLRESLALARRPETAFNLAVVHRAMGETLAAATLLDELLESAFGELDLRRRTEVEATRTEVRAELATLVIKVRSAPAEVRVDGELVARLAPGTDARHSVDAGHHVVVATPTNGDSVERSVEVVRGDLEEVAFDFEESGGRRVIASPWLWLGVAAVVAAAVTVSVVVLSTSTTWQPEDAVWGSAMTLSF